MTLTQIKYFLTTARTLNFTEAAKQLYISQPALSQQITAIERELNMQLFVRANKKVYLTPAAVVLLQELPNYTQHYDDIIAKAQLAQEGNSGYLRIGFLEGQCIAENVLKQYMDFREKHPNIAIEPSCLSFGDLKNQLALDKLDIIYTVEFEVKDIPAVLYKKVAPSYAKVIISKYHPLAKENIISLSQLKNEMFLFLNDRESENVNKLILQDCKEAGFIPNIKYVSSLDENTLCAELGIGIGFTNQDSYACNNRNIVVRKDWTIAERAFVFAWKKENMNPAISLFMNYFAEYHG